MPNNVCLGILHHHERLDGSGYPFGLKANEIHTYGKIVVLADVYDAMRSRRSYKKSAPHEEIMNFLMDHPGTLFDTKLLDMFRSICDK